MIEAGLENNQHIYYGKNRPIDGYEITKQVMSEHPHTDAFFASNDQMAIGCISAINELGLRIPEDVAIAGMDNLFVSTIINPQLTTINIAKYDLGKKAARVLLDKIEADDKSNTSDDMLHILPTDIIVRKSTQAVDVTGWDLYNW